MRESIIGKVLSLEAHNKGWPGLCNLGKGFRTWETIAEFPMWNPGRCVALDSTIQEDQMDEGAELATAGLVVAFAAVLLVASHLFIQTQSAKQVVKGAIELKAATNIVGSWL